MVQFTRDEKETAFGPRHKPPPNYFARAVQVKILMLVFLFLGILFLMSEARKPENWQWMWRLDRNAGAPAGAVPGETTPSEANEPGPIDTRPAREADRADSPVPQITGVMEAKVDMTLDADAPRDESIIKAETDGWNRVLRGLSKDQRLLLQAGMWSWRKEKPLPEEDRAAWPSLLRQLDRHWQDYHERALLGIAQQSDHLTEQQKQVSREMVELSRDRWQQRRQALETIGSNGQPTPVQREALVSLQRILDRRAWSQVEDNTVLLSAETDAWYRCWEQLESLSTDQLAEAKGPLNFVQLFSQSEELRGELVRIAGTAKWGYRVESRNPRFGVEGYFVLGLLSSDGSNSPIVVYCRELPAGFPDLETTAPGLTGTPLDQDVEVIGYYFKRWLHRSRGGMNLSPLILGTITDWQRAASLREREAAESIPPSTLVAAILLLAVLAAGIAVTVYRSSRWSSSEAARSTRPPDALPDFSTQEVQGNVREQLREYSQRQGHDRAM